MRALRCWLSIAAGLGCMIVGLWTPPVVAWVLFIVGLVLLFDGATGMWARAGSTGGLYDHRQ